MRLTSLSGADSFANIGELAFFSLPEREWTTKVYPAMEKLEDSNGAQESSLGASIAQGADETRGADLQSSEESTDEAARQRNQWIAIGVVSSLLLLVGFSCTRFKRGEEVG